MASFHHGARVRLHNLQSQPQHNGSGGVLLVRQNERWQVRLDDATELALRPVNLQLEEPPPLPVLFGFQPRVELPPRRPRQADGPLQMTMLRQVEPSETSMSGHVAHALLVHRHAQRVSLERLLLLPENALASSPLLNVPSCIVIEGVDAERVRPRQLLACALVCSAWAVAVRAWLVSPAARPFWRRVCVAMLPEGSVLHPELCTKEMLLEWVRLRPAVGTRQQWYRCGMGAAESEAKPAPMTELELAELLAQLFVLWWNIGLSDDSPCFVGWYRLYFVPWLDGPTHETEAAPGEWDDAESTPMSLLANVCDCIQDFRMCPNCPNLPDIVDAECSRTAAVCGAPCARLVDAVCSALRLTAVLGAMALASLCCWCRLRRPKRAARTSKDVTLLPCPTRSLTYEMSEPIPSRLAGRLCQRIWPLYTRGE